MRIVILAPSANRHAGGVERFAHNLADVLDPLGSALVLDLSLHARSSRWVRRLGLSSATASFRSRRRLRELEPDIVITNGSAGWSWGRWKRIHVYHGTMVQHSRADRHGRRVRDWLLAGVIGGGVSELVSGLGAHRVAVSRSAALEVERYYRLSVQDVAWNSFLASVENGAAPQAREGLLFVGRRESRKGYEEAVAGAASVGAQLRVAGSGSDTRTVDLGVLDDSGLLDEYVRAAALIFPSRYEACSYVILEALSAGCPVVTTHVGWVQELVSRVPGYRNLLVNPGDVDGIRRVLRNLQSDGPTLARAVADAQELVRIECSPEAFDKRWTRLVVGVVA